MDESMSKGCFSQDNANVFKWPLQATRTSDLWEWHMQPWNTFFSALKFQRRSGEENLGGKSVIYAVVWEQW